MEILQKILIGIYAVVCFVLVTLALIQSKDDEGASSSIMGGGASSNFLEKNKGRTKVGKFKKWTIILSIVFVILTIVIGIMYML